MESCTISTAVNAKSTNSDTTPLAPHLECQPQLLSLYDVLVDVIFCVKDADGVYRSVNNAFVRRTGRTSKRDVLGRTAVDLFDPGLAARYTEQDAQVLSTGQPLHDELELVRRERGSLGWHLTTKLPLDPTPEGLRPGLVSISRDLKTPADDETNVRALGRVVDHVRDNLERGVRPAELATIADLSAAQLDRRMRSTFGLSPSRYIARARVNRAAELLSDPTIPLADVAVRSGFYDQADLTRQFARFTSETPAQFRASQLQHIASHHRSPTR